MMVHGGGKQREVMAMSIRDLGRPPDQLRYFETRHQCGGFPWWQGSLTRIRAAALCSFHHAADLRRFPYSAAGGSRNAALVECYCDTVPRRNPTAPYLRNDRSQLRGSRVGTRNENLAPGFAGLGLPSDFHGFQGEEKTRMRRLGRSREASSSPRALSTNFRLRAARCR
jgi:hypothetical protein